MDSITEHRKAYRETGFWGRAGAGSIVFAKKTTRFLIPCRAKKTLDPNTWATWGGAIDPGETREDTALRELSEESGFLGKVKLFPLNTYKHSSGFCYYNFLAMVDDEFIPTPNWEISNFGWFDYGDWPNPLHFGIKNIFSDPSAIKILEKVISQNTYK